MNKDEIIWEKIWKELDEVSDGQKDIDKQFLNILKSKTAEIELLKLKTLVNKLTI